MLGRAVLASLVLAWPVGVWSGSLVGLCSGMVGSGKARCGRAVLLRRGALRSGTARQMGLGVVGYGMVSCGAAVRLCFAPAWCGVVGQIGSGEVSYGVLRIRQLRRVTVRIGPMG